MRKHVCVGALALSLLRAAHGGAVEMEIVTIDAR